MNITTLQCNSTVEIYLLSKLCTEGSELSKYECVKSYTPMTDAVRQVSGLWLLLVGIIGIFGNVVTLSTIPYAARKRRYGLDKNYYTTTIFILHLAFIDLMHSILIVVPLGILYSSSSSPFGKYGCKLIIYGGVTTLVASMLAISLVALSRCLDMVITSTWTAFCDKKRNILCLFLIVWIPSLIALVISLIIQSYGIEPGWHCETGGCGFIRPCENYKDSDRYIDDLHDIKSCHEGDEIWRLTYFSTICVPAVSLGIAAVSYILIWCKVHRSTKYLLGTEQLQVVEQVAPQLYHRDTKMTKTILILITLNFLFWLPYGVLINTALDLTKKPKQSTPEQYILKVILVSIFETQYAINFFVYVARHKQYRNAFLDAVPFSGRKRKRSKQSNRKRSGHENEN